MQPQLGEDELLRLLVRRASSRRTSRTGIGKLHLPKPRAIFLDDPHDGALAGFGEPALDDSLSGIPPTVKLECHAPRRGRHLRAEPGRTGRKLQRGLPDARTHPEAEQGPRAHPHRRHGTPTLARHTRRVRRRRSPAWAADAYDWNFCWKVWDALRSCAYHGTDCRYALGNTRQHRSNGRWSDGVPVAPLKIQDAAPIRPWVRLDDDGRNPRRGRERRVRAGTGDLARGCERCSRGDRGSRRGQSLSRSPVQASPAWKRYVVDPGGLVYPKRVEVIGAASAVSDPSGLKAAGGAVTTISATGAGAPRLVLDLGANTGGHVEVGITQHRRHGGPARLLGAAQFLTPAGDNCACGDLGLSVGGDDDPDGRTDVIAPSGRSVVALPRHPRSASATSSLQLEGAGTVSIDYVRVRVTHLRAPVSAYAGHFLSSDRLLNRAWYASAYTFAMDSLRDLRPGVPELQPHGGDRRRQARPA